MKTLYNILFTCFAVLYLPSFLMKGKHRAGFASRFGSVPKETQKTLEGKKVLWVHGVSVGEVVQAFHLVTALKKRLPKIHFVITTTTATGREVALKLKSEEDTVLYFPVDFGFSVRRFLKGIHPSALILIETEIWPNLLSELSRRKTPAFIVNGRISDKAITQYRVIRFFVAPFLNLLKAIGAQDDLMKKRFVELGADPGIVSVTGNMKFDWQPTRSGEALAKAAEPRLKGEGKFLLIAGSTHTGEEEILLEVYQSISVRQPRIRLLIAPRHLERSESVMNLALKMGLKMHRISDLKSLQEITEDAIPAPVFLLDTMGVLADFYRIADAVFVGGSLVQTGGHNLVEPAYFEKPVLFGPYMNNFSQMAEEFKKHSAGIEVKDAEELEKNILELIEDKNKGLVCGRNAKELVLRHQGATERNVSVFLETLSNSEES